METNQENKKTQVLSDPETIKIINEKAEREGITPNQALDKIVRIYLAELKEKEQDNTYEENGTINEKVTIDLPKQIVDFYRWQAYLKGIPDLPESLIAFDVADHLDEEIESKSPDDWRKTFKLNEAFAAVSGREALLLRHIEKDE